MMQMFLVSTGIQKEVVKTYTPPKPKYGAEYPTKKKIVYNEFVDKNIPAMSTALKEINKTYGEKWDLYGVNNQSGEFNVLNNIISDTPEEGKKTLRTKNNCCRVRFLYEWDTISIEEQYKITKKLIELGVLQRATFSGSKSVHHIIEIWSETPVKDNNEYKFLHKFIAEQLELTGYDSQCIDNSRLTRAPGVYRKNKGKFQRLIYYNNSARFKCNNWREYYLLSKRKKKISEFEQLQKIIRKIQGSNLKADWSFVENYIKSEEKKGSFNDGNRHNNIGRIVCALKLKGNISCEEVKTVLEPYVSNSSNNDLRNSIEKLYNGAED